MHYAQIKNIYICGLEINDSYSTKQVIKVTSEVSLRARTVTVQPLEK